MKDYRKIARGIVLAEKARQGATFAGLAARLGALGVKVSPAALEASIRRGTMDAGRFLVLMDALQAEVRIEPMREGTP